MTNSSNSETYTATRLHPRTMPIQVEIDGHPVTAYAGESIAAVLMAFTESSFYNLDRSLFCGMGTCHQCLVTVDGVRDVRACMTPVSAGMKITTDAEPSSTIGNPPQQQPFVEKEVDVVIIGAGPAGMAAAATLVAAATTAAEAEFGHPATSHGPTVLLLDAYPQMGGHYYRQPAPTFGPHPLTEGKRQQEFENLHQEAANPSIETLHEATVWSVLKDEDGFEIRVSRPGQRTTIRCEILLGCPGAYDRPFLFPGWHLPGVITLGGAQMLLKGHGILPGKRVLVAGSGPLVLAAAAGLSQAGAEVVAVLDTAGALEGGMQAPLSLFGQLGRLKEGWDYLRAIRQGGAPLKFRHAIFEAQGQEGVERAVYGPIVCAGLLAQHRPDSPPQM